MAEIVEKAKIKLDYTGEIITIYGAPENTIDLDLQSFKSGFRTKNELFPYDGLFFVDEQIIALKDYCVENGFIFNYHDGFDKYKAANGIEICEIQAFSEVNNGYSKRLHMHLQNDDTTVTFCISTDSKIEDIPFSESKIMDLFMKSHIKDATILVGNDKNGIEIDIPDEDGTDRYIYVHKIDGENREFRRIDCEDMKELKTALENVYMYAKIDKNLVMEISEEELKSTELSKSRGAAVEADADDKIELGDD